MVLLKKNINELIDINSKAKRSSSTSNRSPKLPLPLLKRKYEITSKVLEAITEFNKPLDYRFPEFEALGTTMTQIGYNISVANNEFDERLYRVSLDIVEEFISEI